MTTSSTLTIGTDADLTSADLTAQAQSTGHWKADNGPVHFKKAFSSEYGGLSLSDAQTADNRLKCGRQMLENASKEGIHLIYEMLCFDRLAYNLIEIFFLIAI